MTGGEIAYLASAIIAGVVFAVVLAWASHRTGREN